MSLPCPSVLVLPGDRPWRSARAVPVWDLTLVAGVREIGHPADNGPDDQGGGAQSGHNQGLEAVALALDTPEGAPRPLLTHAGGEAVVVVPLDDGRAVLQVTGAGERRSLFAIDPDAPEAPARPLTRLLIEDETPVADLRLLDGHDGVVPLAWCGDEGQKGARGRLVRLASLNGAQATAWWTTVPLPGLVLAADDVPVAVCPLAPGDLVLVVEGSGGLSLWRRPASDAPWARLGDGCPGSATRSALAGLAPWFPDLFLAARGSAGDGGLWCLRPEDDGAPCDPVVCATGSGVGVGTVLDLASVPTPEGDAMAGLLLLTRTEDGAARVLGSTDGRTLKPVALGDGPSADARAPRALALAPGPVGGAPRVLVSP